MIRKIEDLNFYELLEVSPTATIQEIHRAYERLRRIYEPNSIALYSLFTPEETATIHKRIEEAYRTLTYDENRHRYDVMLRERNELPEQRSSSSEAYRTPSVQPASPPREDDRHIAAAPPQPQIPAAHLPETEEITSVSQFIGEFTGAAIKALREQRGLDLRAIADRTKVSTRYLEYIEEEAYQKLPARTYIRGFLMLYAKALGCDPDRMAGDYLKRFDTAAKPPIKK